MSRQAERSADGAIRILKATVPADLVLAGIDLPVKSVDGFGLARWIREQKPGVKILLTSGQVPSPGPAGEVLLVKPYKYPELLQRIRALLPH